MTFRLPESERFWSRVLKTETCWLWTGRLGGSGGAYGWLLRDGGKRVYAHRYSWEIHNGPIPAGMMVCHHCDVPKCVNPAHLFVGTNSDNLRDMKEKGRSCIGERNGQAKLTVPQVEEIRMHYECGERVGVIAAAFGVRHSQISRIISGARRGRG